MTLLCYVWVPGTPATKGSMEHIGHGRLQQSTAGSKLYAKLVTEAVRADRRRRALDIPAPAGTAVELRVTLWLAAPASWPTDEGVGAVWPRSGDADKYARNVGDALTGHAYDDDVQVTRLWTEEIVCAPGEAPGTLVEAYVIEGWQVAQRRRDAARYRAAAVANQHA